MDSRIKTLLDEAMHHFAQRASLVTLWQEIADHFYPERADFTIQRSLGADFASVLMTSYPVICRRDLGDQLGAMMRPRNLDWFEIHTMREERESEQDRRWLQMAARVMKRAMYDRRSQFLKATKQGDHDFAGFGQAVISIERARTLDRLLYRCWHLRDVAWGEGSDGEVNRIYRQWKLPACEFRSEFGANVILPEAAATALTNQKPFTEIKVFHAVKKAADYQDGNKWRTPWVSIYFAEDGTVLEEKGVNTPIYRIPRWVTVSGSQYAVSPATVAALPEDRVLQAICLTVLEAGEKWVSPPMIATKGAIRGDIQLYAGGITIADESYDERLGEVLRPLTQDRAGYPIGRDLIQDGRTILRECFYLDKLSLPPDIGAAKMTATEAQHRVEEYIRRALPIFEPMELEYSGAVCDDTFTHLQLGGAFGRFEDMPQTLRGQDIQFTFKSPLTKAADAIKGAKLQEVSALIAQVVPMDPVSAGILDARVALRDALHGIDTPAKWLRDEDAMQALSDKANQDAAAAKAVQAISTGAAAAKGVGDAATALRTGGLMGAGGLPAAA